MNLILFSVQGRNGQKKRMKGERKKLQKNGTKSLQVLKELDIRLLLANFPLGQELVALKSEKIFHEHPCNSFKFKNITTKKNNFLKNF